MLQVRLLPVTEDLYKTMRLNHVIYEDKDSMFFIKRLFELSEGYSYEIRVKSDVFSGGHDFVLMYDSLRKSLYEVEALRVSSKGECLIKDSLTESFVKLCFDKKGELLVSGQFGNIDDENVLKFKFKADKEMLAELRMILLN